MKKVFEICALPAVAFGIVAVVFWPATTAHAQETQTRQFTRKGELIRPVHTYSIVARDPETGQLGVAVQSHWFSVGQMVPWAEAGVGAIATQSFVDPSYGRKRPRIDAFG